MSSPKDKAQAIKKHFEKVLLKADYNIKGFAVDELKIKCARISVEQIIEALNNFGYSFTTYDDFETGKITSADETDPVEYWQKVLKELE